MDIRDGFSESVGNTPLIKLRKLSEQTGCTILGKAEIVLLREEDNVFRVECWRSFSAYVLAFLSDAARAPMI